MEWEVDAWMRKTLGRGLELDEEDADDAWKRQPNQLSSFQVEFSRSTACVAPIYAKALLKASMQFKILVEEKTILDKIKYLVATARASALPPPPKTFPGVSDLRDFMFVSTSSSLESDVLLAIRNYL